MLDSDPREVARVAAIDGIPNVALKAAVNADPYKFRTTMQRCIDQEIFPDVKGVHDEIATHKIDSQNSSFHPIAIKFSGIEK